MVGIGLIAAGIAIGVVLGFDLGRVSTRLGRLHAGPKGSFWHYAPDPWSRLAARAAYWRFFGATLGTVMAAAGLGTFLR